MRQHSVAAYQAEGKSEDPAALHLAGPALQRDTSPEGLRPLRARRPVDTRPCVRYKASVPRDIQISRFRRSHLPRILEIERASFPEEAYTRAIFLELYRECEELFLVAKRSRRIVGYIVSGAGSRKADIISIAVDPEYRNMGVGKALILHAIDKLRELGAGRLELTVRTTSTAAIRLYGNLGFCPLMTIAHYYQDGGDGLRMWMRL